MQVSVRLEPVACKSIWHQYTIQLLFNIGSQNCNMLSIGQCQNWSDALCWAIKLFSACFKLHGAYELRPLWNLCLFPPPAVHTCGRAAVRVLLGPSWALPRATLGLEDCLKVVISLLHHSKRIILIEQLNSGWYQVRNTSFLFSNPAVLLRSIPF